MRWLVCAAVVLCAAPAAGADDDRAVVDRAELAPVAFGGYRLRVYASAVALGGQLLDLGEPGALHAYVDGVEVVAPYALGRFATATDAGALEVVFVIERAAAYRDVLPVIAEALDREVVAALPVRARVAVMPYAAAIGAAELGSVRTARARLGALATDADDGSGAPALADAVERALALLRAAPTVDATRRIVVVIGDGRDAADDRARITLLATAAGAAGVRIHAIGFAPTDARRPLLALGELARRSLGTFRWVRGPRDESWQPALAQLRDEVTRQYVATWFVDDASAADRPLRLVTTGRVALASNEVRVTGDRAAGRGPRASGERDASARLGEIVARGGVAVLVLALVLVSRRRRLPRSARR